MSPQARNTQGVPDPPKHPDVGVVQSDRLHNVVGIARSHQVRPGLLCADHATEYPPERGSPFHLSTRFFPRRIGGGRRDDPTSIGDGRDVRGPLHGVDLVRLAELGRKGPPA